PREIIMVDTNRFRLDAATKLGATHVVDSAQSDAVEAVLAHARDGVDVAIDAVGVPQTFDICQRIVPPGGHIANIGVHARSVEQGLHKLWIQNLTQTTGLVNTATQPMPLKTLAS